MTAIVLSSCQNLGVVMFDKRTTAGALPITQPEQFRRFDVVQLLDPEAESLESKKDELTEKESAKRLANAIATFEGDDDEIIRRRNSIQDAMILASNQSCSEYEQYLRQYDVNVNSIFGGLTTLSGGLGAIFTPADTVRSLSGAAAIFSGVRAELNQAHFANQTVQVITNGIKTKRYGICQQIEKNRKTPEYKDYTVARAIADVVTYHQGCTAIAGLEAASLAVTRVENPGIKDAAKIYQQILENDAASRLIAQKAEAARAAQEAKKAETMLARANRRLAEASERQQGAANDSAPQEVLDEIQEQVGDATEAATEAEREVRNTRLEASNAEDEVPPEPETESGICISP